MSDAGYALAEIGAVGARRADTEQDLVRSRIGHVAPRQRSPRSSFTMTIAFISSLSR